MVMKLSAAAAQVAGNLEAVAGFERVMTLSFMAAQVQRDFARPEGVAEGDMDAAAEPGVMAVLDLRADDSLRNAGLAREVVNRVQKLRKKAGLQVSNCTPSTLAHPSGNWPQSAAGKLLHRCRCLQQRQMLGKHH